jgi:hypothetical protein
MRVLVACEFSGVVRDAFRKRGHDAWSCDLLPSEADPRWHIHGNVSDILGDRWDLMIAHPPCTYLCSSGMHWTARGLRDPKLTEDALEFVRCLMNAPISRIAVENPVGCISSRIRKPDQIIQPWMFGHPESKATCLWLKNLPNLKPTNVLQKPAIGRWDNQTPSGQNKLGPGEKRWAERSRTYQGIADAMAEQWSESALSLPTNCSPVGNAVSRGVQLTMTTMQNAIALGQATQRTKGGELCKSKGYYTRNVIVEPYAYMLALALSRTR